MRKLFEKHSFSISLAHRYWVEGLTEAENSHLFASSASSEGLGHNFDVSITFDRSSSDWEKQDILNKVKFAWDHSSWLETPPDRCSSLEVLVWQMASDIGSRIEELTVGESARLKLGWFKRRPEELTLTYTRPLSILWKEGGGARPNFDFHFQSSFNPEHHVLFPRSVLETELEKELLKLESSGLELFKVVKENEEIMDAMLNRLRVKTPLLVSIGCELEKEKKWLIHSPIFTR